MPTPGLLEKRARFLQLLFWLLFIGWRMLEAPSEISVRTLPPAPPSAQARFLSFGEAPSLARLSLFWLQSYDSRAGRIISFQALDYARLIDWLALSLALDPHSQYALLTASRIFTEVKDPARLRQMLGFVQSQFIQAPQTRWRWQAEAVLLAKHRLRDGDLALSLAQTLRRETRAGAVPHWARDMEHLILAERGELQAAVNLIDLLLVEGEIHDANEIRFLTRQMKDLQRRQRLQTDENAQK